MKILQVNAVKDKFSTGRTMKEMDLAIKEKGYESFQSFRVGDLSENNYKFDNLIDAKFHSLFSRISGLQGYFSKKETKKFLKWVDTIKPDVIHLRNLHDNYINFNDLISYCCNKNIPVLFTLHDSWFYNARNSDIDFDLNDLPSNIIDKNTITKMDNKSWFFNRDKKILTDRNILFSNLKYGVVGVSKWITERSQNSYMNKSVVSKTIYNWVDTNVFFPRNEIISTFPNFDNKFIILGVASFWTKSKGFDIFISLSSAIGKDEIIVLLGKVDSNISLPKNIINIETTDDVNFIAELYSLAGVFLNLSLIETFGKVSAEAQACGTPVITNKYTANPEIVTTNTGIVLEKINVESVTNAIRIIRSRPKNFYSRACIENVRTKFDMEINTNMYINIYKLLIEGKD